MDEIPTTPSPPSNNLLTLLFALTFLAIGRLVGFYLGKSSQPAQPKPKQEEVVCAQDVKECPDGSFVSRTGPNCDCAPYPAPSDPTALLGEQKAVK